MGVRAYTPTTTDLMIGQLWSFDVGLSDAAGATVDDAPSVVVTLPGGTTVSPTFERVCTGRFRATHVVGTAGRYVAVVTSLAGGTAGFAAWVGGTVAGAGMPTAADVIEYLTDQGGTSYDEPAVEKALDAEAAAQRKVCNVPAIYTADLREALLRRVARNLALRKLPLAVLRGDAEGGGDTVLPGSDPEVKRLELPYRKDRRVVLLG